MASAMNGRGSFGPFGVFQLKIRVADRDGMPLQDARSVNAKISIP
jgi:hypothetical protein